MKAMNMELFLVRHGETEWNATGRFCGHSDPPLTQRGRAQAAALRGLLAGESFDRAVSSPSIRALETTRIVYGEPETDERLRELDFGDLEGLVWSECSPDIRQRLAHYDTFQAPGGESVRALGERVLRALSDLGPGRHLVVTHGGVIRFLAGKAAITEYPKTATLTCLVATLRQTDSDLEIDCAVIPQGSPAGEAP